MIPKKMKSLSEAKEQKRDNVPSPDAPLPSSKKKFSDKKNQIPKILHMWVFVSLKCWQNFKILQLVLNVRPNKSRT